MLFVWALLGVLLLMTILWLISIPLKNVSIVDIFWGIGYLVAISFYTFLSDDIFTRQWILFVLVLIWSLRLSGYLFFRNYGKGEDFRYQEFRKHFGAKRYWWFSFFQVFLLQGALIMLVSLPLLGVNLYTLSNELNALDYVAILVWIIGFFFESVGDYQLTKFKDNPNNKGKVLDTGLWRYTRHPNYFGDAAVWWSFGLFSIASGAYWYVAGSLLMTYLIIKISGVSLLERSLNDAKPKYKDYIERTSAFIPWFPKKIKND
ncbi:MAG: DUF1295 domain-containing protein [Bacteroidia bacterium]|nr:DUF1295 domain-containing protein [Bacteroidia bacterium]